MRIKQIFLLSLHFSSVIIYGQSFSYNGLNYTATSEETLEVVAGSYSGKITIPSKVIKDFKTYTVKSIGEEAFLDCTSLESITLPDSLREIGKGAFMRCEKLKQLSIPNYVKNIGENAFGGCIGLKSITLPNSLLKIEYRYEYSYRMRFFPKNIREMLSLAFVGCSSIESITLLGTSLEVGYADFLESRNQKDITIPNYVKVIDLHAFANCRRLESVLLPDSLEEIGSDAFAGCINLKRLILPKSPKK